MPKSGILKDLLLCFALFLGFVFCSGVSFCFFWNYKQKAPEEGNTFFHCQHKTNRCILLYSYKKSFVAYPLSIYESYFQNWLHYKEKRNSLGILLILECHLVTKLPIRKITHVFFNRFSVTIKKKSTEEMSV